MFDLRRYWYQHRVHGGPMEAFLEALPADLNHDYRAVEFLALDLETTGLDPKHDAIVSIGSVPIIGGRVVVGESEHVLVRAGRSVAQSAVVHGILDDELDDGLAEEEALTHVLERLCGRVLLVHHAPFDVECLNNALKRAFGVPLCTPVVDTMALALRDYNRRGEEPPEGALRLPALRERYGLPRASQHDALADALATAELFLAMAAERAGNEPLPVRLLV